MGLIGPVNHQLNIYAVCAFGPYDPLVDYTMRLVVAHRRAETLYPVLKHGTEHVAGRALVLLQRPSDHIGNATIVLHRSTSDLYADMARTICRSALLIRLWEREELPQPAGEPIQTCYRGTLANACNITTGRQGFTVTVGGSRIAAVRVDPSWPLLPPWPEPPTQHN